ncbi:type II secretion system protein GspD [Fontisphaera persica]|uniref:type II secretion system protein GspD n=1 Tax=Fontisphaera persica TaxID=2974023 RepID=UPI0024C0B304|nr:type II secretion system protein GspD [Fontisphaera persica]WCJ60490.1 type II secretion system protein GspD [Fontisphaera persica]
MRNHKTLSVAVLVTVAFALVSCQSDKPKPTAAKPASFPKKEGKYSTFYDEEIREIFDLAEHNRWDEAERKAAVLRQRAPEDETVKRVQDWVAKNRLQQRDSAVENKIREIDAKNSALNPTLPDLLTENKDRGLPARRDVRDAVQQIEATPYIPENYGKSQRQRSQLFDLESPEGRMAKILEKEVSIHLDNVTLEAIIFNLGQAEGINFVADKNLPAFKQTLSVNMEKVKLGEFLRYVSRNLDVQFQVGNDLIWIIDAKDPKRVVEETRIYRLRHGFVIPAQFGPEQVNRITTTTPQVTTVTENVKLTKFVNDGAPETPVIENVIKQFFTGSKYLIDYERNVIVARGTRDQLEVLDRIIEEFDRPLQQVLIEARFITISEAAFLQLGAAWETARDGRPVPSPQDFTGLGTFSGLKNDLSTGIQKSWTNIFPKVLGRSELSVTLTALQQSGEGQTLSAPRLTLVNNLPAMISDGKIQYYYEEYTVKQTVGAYNTASSLVPQGKPTKITSGVSLHVVASIGGDGRTILLALNPEVNQDVKMVTFAEVKDFGPDGKVSGSFEIRLPESRTQSLATRVLVQSGQTVVMGGVLEREQRTFVESTPILGSIPIIGAAFRKRTELNKPRYLLIFVTATLLTETGELLIAETEAQPPRSLPRVQTLSYPHPKVTPTNAPPPAPAAAPATPPAPAPAAAPAPNPTGAAPAPTPPPLTPKP